MSYQDTLKHLQETLHIERQLKTYPEWIMYAFMVFSGLLMLAFVYSYMNRTWNGGYPTANPSKLRAILNGSDVIGFIGTCIIGIIALGYARPYVSLTQDSEQRITTYLSQLDTDEYAKLKQQVEVNRNTSFDNKTTQSIHEQLKSTLSPENRRTFFFFFKH